MSFVLRRKDNGSYIALDEASGGYPYDVPLERAHRFSTIEGAEKYNAVSSWQDYDNPVYSVEELLLSTQPVESASGKDLERLRYDR